MARKAQAVVSFGRLKATVTMGGWRCEDETMQNMLNLLHHPANAYVSRNVLADVAAKAADELDGKLIEVPDDPPEKPGIVY